MIYSNIEAMLSDMKSHVATHYKNKDNLPEYLFKIADDPLRLFLGYLCTAENCNKIYEITFNAVKFRDSQFLAAAERLKMIAARRSNFIIKCERKIQINSSLRERSGKVQPCRAREKKWATGLQIKEN